MRYMNTIFVFHQSCAAKNLSPPEQGEADLVYF